MTERQPTESDIRELLTQAVLDFPHGDWRNKLDIAQTGIVTLRDYNHGDTQGLSARYDALCNHFAQFGLWQYLTAS